MRGETLREWRRFQGWDVPEMARRMRMAAGDTPLPSHDSVIRMIRRWERGTYEVSERYELLYAAAFGVDPRDLRAGPAHEVASTIPEGDDDLVHRREFGIAAFGLLATSMVPKARIPGSVSAAHVEVLQRATAQLWTRDRQVGGTALLREAAGHYAMARSMLDNSRYSSAVGLDLQAATAELAACAGFIAFDAARQQTARDLFTESVLLAGSAGAQLLVAHAYALLALQCSSLAASADRPAGLAREAMRFLDQAAAAARSVASPRVHSLVSMRRATAAALLGDESGVRVHISAARRELDRGDHPADPGWAAFVTPTEVTAHEAAARLSLGQVGHAAELFRDVASDGALDSRNRIFYRAQLARSLCAAGDQTEGVAEGLAVLPALDGPVQSARTMNILRSIRRLTAPESEFAVRFDAIAVA
jgi:transcriptional regulator with XRE-family HTH domain